jgi:hypothetical protein
VVPIDFSDPAHRSTYSGRTADRSWHEAMAGWVAAAGRTVADVGCGGGRYVVQDRTAEDVTQLPAPRHVRGWFSAVQPRLLDVAELDELVARMRAELPAGEPVVEQDRWTVWTATRPG